jgi:hypothetical protein
VVHCFRKEFQDEQTATGEYRRLPRIGDSGFRTIAEQFDHKFTHCGPAADQQSQSRLAVHNDPTIDVDTIDRNIHTEYAGYRVRSSNPAFIKFGGQPACG